MLKIEFSPNLFICFTLFFVVKKKNYLSIKNINIRYVRKYK